MFFVVIEMFFLHSPGADSNTTPPHDSPVSSQVRDCSDLSRKLRTHTSSKKILKHLPQNGVRLDARAGFNNSFVPR